MESNTTVRDRPSTVSSVTGLTEFGSVGTFLREFISNPRTMGAAFPSSRKLAALMASHIPRNFDGWVVELGPGTGVVTAEILQRGIAQHRVLSVEFSSELVQMLKQRFPDLGLIHGDAGHLDTLLAQHLGETPAGVEWIISSLPLRSLPKPTLKAINLQLERLMTPTARWVQFTYDIRPGIPCPLPSLEKLESKIIWPNIPPARVEWFRKRT